MYPSPRYAIQRSHDNKHEVLGASPVWTIFVLCQVAISRRELPRTYSTKFVNKGKNEGRSVPYTSLPASNPTIMRADRITSQPMSIRPERLKQTLNDLRQALEGFESALLEFEETLEGEEQERFQAHKSLDLLSIPEVCQELGMGKSWVYKKVKSAEIPSVKLGRTIKVARRDLEGYLEDRRYRPLAEK
jgi:excisionase family DNA binding protein